MPRQRARQQPISDVKPAKGVDTRSRLVVRLCEIAEQLRDGKHFPIARLTMIKAACTDPVVTARFVLHLVVSVQHDAKQPFRRLIGQAVDEVERCLKTWPTPPGDSVRKALANLRDSQSEIEHHRWADVRIIHSKEALLAEYALSCLAYPDQPQFWGYHAARAYAEKYDPRCDPGRERTGSRTSLGTYVVEPATEVHLAMLEAAAELAHPEGWPSYGKRITTQAEHWLSPACVSRVRQILAKGRRIPEEVLHDGHFRCLWQRC